MSSKKRGKKLFLVCKPASPFPLVYLFCLFIFAPLLGEFKCRFQSFRQQMVIECYTASSRAGVLLINWHAGAHKNVKEGGDRQAATGDSSPSCLLALATAAGLRAPCTMLTTPQSISNEWNNAQLYNLQQPVANGDMQLNSRGRWMPLNCWVFEG